MNGVTDSGTRSRILDAAATLFLSYGYKRTSVEDIASNAGVAKGTVYTHFSSKEEVFAGVSKRVCGEVIEQLEHIAGSESSIEEKLTQMSLRTVLYVWDFAHQAPHAPELWTEVLAAAKKYALPAYEEGRRLMAKVVAEGQDAGVFRRDLDSMQVAWLIQHAGQGFSMPFILVEKREDIEQRLPVLISLIVQGLYTKANTGE